MKQDDPRAAEFVLAPVGPVDRMQERARITSPDKPRLIGRAVTMALILWLPLIVLTLLHPNRHADIPFWKDLAANVRFLIIIPMLIIAEGPIGQRSRMVVQQFSGSGIVSEADAGRYETIRRRGRRMLDSTIAEVILLVLSALLVWVAFHALQREDVSFWFEKDPALGSGISPAGWWYFVVATPVIVFLLLRWVWRYLIWWWFLDRVSRLDLHLTGTHPDRMGGLGFVCFNQSVFAAITFPVGCAVSALAADRILYAGATLKSYQIPIVVITVFSVLIGVAPLLAFTRRLLPLRRTSWLSYSRFASEYVWSFEQKWLRGAAQESPLGSSDIQSLADLGGSFERMIGLRPIAIDRRIILSFALAAIAPALPLVLTVMPLKDVIKLLMKAMI